MEHSQNDTDRGKPNYSEKSLFQYHSAHHKSQTKWPGTEAGLLR